MTPPSHLLSGWCIANLADFTSRERFICMIIAIIPDLDGLGLIISQEAYLNYHHMVGHNLIFGLLISVLLCLLSEKKLKVFVLYISMFHVHLFMDYLGSGTEWTIVYFWPISNWYLYNSYGWELNSWQNSIITLFLIGFTLLIVAFKRRTPIEFIFPKLEKRIFDNIQ